MKINFVHALRVSSLPQLRDLADDLDGYLKAKDAEIERQANKARIQLNRARGTLNAIRRHSTEPDIVELAVDGIEEIDRSRLSPMSHTEGDDDGA